MSFGAMRMICGISALSDEKAPVLKWLIFKKFPSYLPACQIHNSALARKSSDCEKASAGAHKNVVKSFYNKHTKQKFEKAPSEMRFMSLR